MNLIIEEEMVKKILLVRGHKPNDRNVKKIMKEINLWSNDLVENLIDIAVTSANRNKNI
ncbi:TPA: hypothetical protein QC364_000775 [Bacillus cereus]|uniref:hypothetical protein n=1 Tax=Bacillus paranthracis TaxID=2026186 RepID=UPI002D78B1D7|nr:hypothetical protein [Bacillus paranthracis]HDR8453983.1 hypothetical protein [Bacillus cereus]